MAYGDARLLPGMSDATICSLVQEHLARLNIHASQLDDLLGIPAVETDPQAEIVQHLAAAVESVMGTSPRLAGSGLACHGWMCVIRGIPAVCRGV